MKRKIYLASSWRNPVYPLTVLNLREDGHEVYDFRADGFRWDELHPAMPHLSVKGWLSVIRENKRAQDHFAQDWNALQEADTVVQVLPSGRSASWETGYALGAGKDTFLYIFPDERFEAELMVLMFEPRVFTVWTELRKALLAETPVLETEQPDLMPQIHQPPFSPPTDMASPPAREKRSRRIQSK
jgi:nucleoside 2-deoxyribosyltransferase